MVFHDHFCEFRPTGIGHGGMKRSVRSNSGSDEVDRFAWIAASAIQEAACLTFVRNIDVERVAESFGAVRERGRTLDFDEFCEEAFAHYEQYSMIGVRRIGDWLLVVEDNAAQGSRQEVLRRVSADTDVVSASWTVNTNARFSYAVDGAVRTSFDARSPETRDGTRPDSLEEFRAGLPWWPDVESHAAEPGPLMLALSARITGHPLAPEAFDGDFQTYPVAEWPDDLPHVPDLMRRRLGPEYPPELLESLHAADGPTRRQAALAVAHRALERAGCADHPVIRTTLASMTPEHTDGKAISDAVRAWTWHLNVHRTTSKVRAQLRAAEVLRQATNEDPLTAVFAVLAEAPSIRGVEGDELVELVWRTLQH